MASLACAVLMSACGGGGLDDPLLLPLTLLLLPFDQFVVSDGTARFSVQASGDNLRFQWEVSGDGGNSWLRIQGATDSTVDVVGVTQAQDGTLYRVVVSGAGGSITTSAVTLHVSALAIAPKFVIDLPAQTSVVEGQNKLLEVGALGTSLSYRWQTSADGALWTDVAGANSRSLQLLAVSRTLNGRRFRVIVNNTAGAIVSNTLTLQVVAAAAQSPSGS